MPPKRLSFYFDVLSPYGYLAWTQLPALVKEFDLELQIEPVLLAALLNHSGNKGPAEIPEKRLYTITDMLRWAKRMAVKIEGPPTHPFNPLLPMRCVMATSCGSERERFTDGLLRAVWSEGRDPTRPAELLAIATAAGLHGTALLEKAESAANKDALKASNTAAIARGVFGVPTLIVDDQIFWGNDRMDFLRDYLETGEKVDAGLLKRILQRPASARRP